MFGQPRTFAISQRGIDATWAAEEEERRVARERRTRRVPEDDPVAESSDTTGYFALRRFLPHAAKNGAHFNQKILLPCLGRKLRYEQRDGGWARTEMSHLDWIGDACARASVTRDIHKVEDLPNAARHLTGLSFSDALGRCCHGGDQGRRRSNGVL